MNGSLSLLFAVTPNAMEVMENYGRHINNIRLVGLAQDMIETRFNLKCTILISPIFLVAALACSKESTITRYVCAGVGIFTGIIASLFARKLYLETSHINAIAFAQSYDLRLVFLPRSLLI